jgi:hypothetical protein
LAKYRLPALPAQCSLCKVHCGPYSKPSLGKSCASTLGATRLTQQVTEFQKLQRRENNDLQPHNKEALNRLIAESDIALQFLEAFFQAELVGAEISA